MSGAIPNVILDSSGRVAARNRAIPSKGNTLSANDVPVAAGFVSPRDLPTTSIETEYLGEK